MSSIVGTAELGSPTVLSEKKTMVFKFHDFASLGKGEHETPSLTCHGHQWYVSIYPWGYSDKAKAKESTCVFLDCKSNNEGFPKAEFSIRAAGKEVNREHTFTTRGGYGINRLETRSKIISALDSRGTLTVNIDLQIWVDDKKPAWRPEDNIRQKLTRLYNAEEGSDVTFTLGSDLVRSHRYVVAMECPTLLEFGSESAITKDANIPIDNTDADLFAIMIRFMYYKELPSDFDLPGNGAELLKLANRFGYQDLKMNLEADLVDNGSITIDTAADFLLLADAHSCALLKDVAMKFIAKYSKEVMKSAGWKSLKQSNDLLEEVLMCLSDAGGSGGAQENVSSLRKRLAAKGLDADGTKEMLVKRLKRNDDEEDDEEVEVDDDDDEEDEA